MTETRQFNFANFARSTLLESITAGQTELSVAAEYGSRFPDADATYDEIFAIVVSSGSAYEIMYVTAKAGDVFTVERGKEGTTAVAWPTGSTIVHTATAGFFEQTALDLAPDNPVLTGESSATEEATLTWTTPAVGTVVTFDLYRATNGGAAALLDDDVTSPYVDTTLVSPNIYSYYIVANMDDLTTRQSNTVDVDSAFFETFLLLHAEFGEVYDVTGVSTVTPVGGGAMSGVQALFGDESFYNPGTATEGTNYLSVVGAIDDFVFPGEFTWEGWFYVEAYGSGYTNFVSNNINFPSTGFIQLAVGPGPSRTFFFNSSGGVVSGGDNAVSAGAWHHLALTRDSGNNLRIFCDGVLLATNSTGATTIGGNNAGVSTFDLMRGIAGDNDDVNGYIEEFRVTKACRYTANFTPPTAPFPPYPGI